MEQIIVAIGSNVGDAPAHVELGWRDVVAALELATPRRSRRWWSRAAEGASGGPDFVNAVGVGWTKRPATEALALLQAIERGHGRDRVAEGVHGARPLDLDLVAYGELRLDDGPLLLPHPRALDRDFVLLPLLELLPHYRAPGDAHSAAERLRALPTRTLRAAIDPAAMAATWAP